MIQQNYVDRVNMNNITAVTAFFGWCSILSIGILIYTTIMLSVFKGLAKSMHTKWFGISEEQLDIQYFTFLGHLKIAIIIFNIVPYLALRIIS